MLRAFAIVCALAPLATPVAAGTLSGCDAFIASLRNSAGDMHVDFNHSIIVSRAKSDTQVFDVTTNAEVSGTLTCRGDEFVRFEARVAEPASGPATSSFERFLAASLRAALGWDSEKASAVLHGMTSDVREFLAASKERGDAYIAGKTEEHEPGGVGLGLIYTETDRALIIVGPEG